MKEVSERKVNMLLLNKADLLTRDQRRIWARYFQKEGIRAVFWSALAEGQRLDAEEKVRKPCKQCKSDARNSRSIRPMPETLNNISLLKKDS